MKFILNKCYGGFGLSDEFCDSQSELNARCRDRNDIELIKRIEDYAEIFGMENINTKFSELEIVEIPDEATDYMINEYDGYENIIYVLDGKIHMM